MGGSGPPDETQGPGPEEPELPPWPQMARPTWHNQYGGAPSPYGGQGPNADHGGGGRSGGGCLILVCVLISLAIASALVWVILIR
jgi:hypothetical protein